jgi:hypothetical protein
MNAATTVPSEAEASEPGVDEFDGHFVPRHPIVLVHGVLGFVRRAVTRLVSFSYFHGVQEHLEESGVRVISKRVAGVQRPTWG